MSGSENGKSLCSPLLCGVTLTYSFVMNWTKWRKETVMDNFLERFIFRCLTNSSAKKIPLGFQKASLPDILQYNNI